MYWNYWKLELHWNKLEWINPRSKIKIKQPYSVFFLMIMILERVIGLAIQHYKD